MKKWIFTLIFILWTNILQAQITAQLSDTEVNPGQTFKLILTQDISQNPGLPNLVSLQKDFVILGTERSVSYTLINGQANSVSQWTIVLEAKRTGRLTIPAITIDGQSSKPLSIVVNDTPSPTHSIQQHEGNPVRLITEVNNTEPYVNQEIIYTVKLITSQRLLDAEYQGPQVEDALIIPLGNAKRYQTVENNIPYSILEQRYAIFPQKSGTLNIQSPLFQALVYDVVPKRVRAKDKSMTLNIKAMPSNYKGQYWLPAKDVNLSQEYDNPSQSFRQGDTLVRTITINSVGAPAQLLPKLRFKSSDRFSVYPEKPKERNVFRNQQLVGTATIKITYLFSKAGDVTIPELRLPWFNTTSGKEVIAKLPALTFKVKPVKNQSKTTLTKAIPEAKQPNDKPQNNVQSLVENNHNLSHAWILAAIFGIAWMFTLILWYWQDKKKNTNKKAKRQVFRALQQACQENNPENARDALLTWARMKWPEANFLNLAELAKFIHNNPLKNQIHQLSQALYDKAKKTSWQGRDLWACIISLKTMKKTKKSKANALPPMNPVDR